MTDSIAEQCRGDGLHGAAVSLVTKKGQLIQLRPEPRVDEMSDAGLVAACAAADRTARALLFERHVDAIHRFVARMRGSDADVVDDLVQATFMRAFQGAARFRGASARSWLFGIAANVVREHARSEIRRKRALSVVAERAAARDRAPRCPLCSRGCPHAIAAAAARAARCARARRSRRRAGQRCGQPRSAFPRARCGGGCSRRGTLLRKHRTEVRRDVPEPRRSSPPPRRMRARSSIEHARECAALRDVARRAARAARRRCAGCARRTLDADRRAARSPPR